MPVRIVEFAGTRWPNQVVQAPSSVIRPNAGISSVPALDVAAHDLGFSLVDHGLVEPGAAAPGLIDDVARHALAHEVGIPAFATVRRRFQARSRVTRSVHHDDGPSARVFLGRNLELHVHLADRDLMRSGRNRAGGAESCQVPVAEGASRGSVTFGTPPMKKLP